jgi:hypothetical protein
MVPSSRENILLLREIDVYFDRSAQESVGNLASISTHPGMVILYNTYNLRFVEHIGCEILGIVLRHLVPDVSRM